MTESITKLGLSGVQRGLELTSRDVARLTQSFLEGSDIDPVEPLVSLKMDAFQVEASAAVIRTGADLERSLLDILA